MPYFFLCFFVHEENTFSNEHGNFLQDAWKVFFYLKNKKKMFHDDTK